MYMRDFNLSSSASLHGSAEEGGVDSAMEREGLSKGEGEREDEVDAAMEGEEGERVMEGRRGEGEDL
jgi:hypothetical protein